MDDVFEETLFRLTEESPEKEEKLSLFLDHFYEELSEEET